jgi:hypothetical protein
MMEGLALKCFLQIPKLSSPFPFIGRMPPSKRKTRRKVTDLQETSEIDLPESSPSRPSPKKRKVWHSNWKENPIIVLTELFFSRLIADDPH